MGGFNISNIKIKISKILSLLLSFFSIISFLGCIKFGLSYLTILDSDIKIKTLIITTTYGITTLVSLYGFLMILKNKFKIGRLVSFIGIGTSLFIILIIQIINNNLTSNNIIGFIEPDYIFTLGIDMLSGGFLRNSSIGLYILDFFTSSILYTYKLMIINSILTLIVVILLPNKDTKRESKGDTIKNIRIISVIVSVITILSIIGGIDLLIYRKNLSSGFLEFLYRNYALLLSIIGLVILTIGLIFIAIKKYYEGKLMTFIGSLFLAYNIFASVKLSSITLSELSDSMPIDYFLADALSLLTFSIDSNHNLLGIGRIFTSDFISQYKLAIILLIVSLEIVIFLHFALKNKKEAS